MSTCEKFIREDWSDDTARFIEKHTKSYYYVDWDIKNEIEHYMKRHIEYKNCTLDAVWGFTGINTYRVDADISTNYSPMAHPIYTWYEYFLVDNWLYTAQITNYLLANEYDRYKKYEEKLKKS